MVAKVLLVGAGRMGLRHLSGLRAAGAEVTVVDPRADARAQAEGARATAASLEEALAAGGYDAAVLAETAAGRLERFLALAEAGVPRVLVEKPVEQSRSRMLALVEAAEASRVDARVNHVWRSLELLPQLRGAGGPFHLSVTGGAFGLACNGIHWLDLAVALSGDVAGMLLHGELDETPIASGRGPDFRDYGGRALYAFPDGSRLYLSSAASSSAPAHATIDQAHRQTVLFPHESLALLYERASASTLPVYRYGADYGRREATTLPADVLVAASARWLRGEGTQPPLRVSALAHSLLFDLLETGGETHFPVT